MRRRSSGAIVACNARISEIAADAQAAVPWLLDLGVDPGLTETQRLTEREMEIVTLAANGARNRDIAEALLLSIRTVESHLAQARAKLGAASRGDLVKHFGAATIS